METTARPPTPGEEGEEQVLRGLPGRGALCGTVMADTRESPAVAARRPIDTTQGGSPSVHCELQSP